MEKSDAHDEKVESNVTKVLTDDGIKSVSLEKANQYHYRAKAYKAELSNAPWAHRIIYNNDMSGVLICQPPGTGNRTHCHRDHEEWWVVLQGKIKWWFETIGEVHAETGDIVHVPRGVPHKIRTEGDGPSIRLAISIPDIPHFHPETDPAPAEF
jgi:quercetin dioxygenase-like cupin family protein